MTKNNIERSCVDCATTGCDHCGLEEAFSGSSGAFPAFCKTADLDPAILEEAMRLYTENEENNRITRMSAQVAVWVSRVWSHLARISRSSII